MLKLYGAMKKALGKDFPLEAVMSVSEPGKNGWTVADTIEFARLAQGTIDILHLRGGIADPQHPTGFTSTVDNQMPYLEEIGQVKKACVEQGIDIIIAASSGFHDLDLAEKALVEGKCDLIAMARSWICDPEYGKKAYEGRGEDVVPCIRCNKCHVSNASDYFRSICSVNPVLGMEHKVPCGTVLYSVGTRENFDEAIALFGTVANTRMIGDCEKAGNVQKAMRSAYAAAMQI